MISSTAAFDGAQIRSFFTPDVKSMETIPVIVCVLPVPGYIIIFIKIKFHLQVLILKEYHLITFIALLSALHIDFD